MPTSARLLGLPDPPSVVHVFLSDRATHEQRFPERRGGEAAGCRRRTAVRGHPRAESFLRARRGSPHRLEPRHTGRGFLTARRAIFLDCETIGQIAEELGLELEPVLGSTAIHELSHIVRGHATSDGSRTHGFAREGDAQRDAWAVKGAMLAASSTRATALAGRAAQVRLARNQPRAYTMFGYDSADRHHWHHNEPAPTTHLIRTPRNLLAVVKEDIVVLPVRPVLRPVPEVGDLVYLAEKRDDGDFFVVGPWVVLNREHEAAVMADKDRREVEKADKEHRGGRSSFEYLVLRPANLAAARAIPWNDLPAIGIPYCAAEAGDWMTQLQDNTDTVLEERRQERRDEDEEFWRHLSEEVGQDMRPADWSFDPDAE